MKLKVLVNLGTSEFPQTPFAADSVHEVDERLGNKLLARRLAELVEESPKESTVAVSPRVEREKKAAPKAAMKVGSNRPG